jgi:hypothetical protein
MKKPALVLVLGLAGAVVGCSTDQIARVVYYTFRVDNQAVNNSQSAPLQPQGTGMSFDQYQRERRGEASR